MAIGNWPTNAAMIADVARLGYLRAEWRTLDPTYGEFGGFWKKWRPDELVAHDALTDGVDFRHLPHGDGEFPAVVFDGPYKLNGRPDPRIDARYGVGERATRDERHALLFAGLWECARVTAPAGFLLAKCQDQVNGGKVRWQTDLFTGWAADAGLHKVDSFLFTSFRPQPETNPDGSPRSQKHARHNFSTLLVFQKPRPRRKSAR